MPPQELTVTFTEIEERTTSPWIQYKFVVTYRVTGLPPTATDRHLPGSPRYSMLIVIDTDLVRRWRVPRKDFIKLAYEAARERIRERLRQGQLHHTEITMLLDDSMSPQERPYDLAHVTVALDTPMAFFVGE